VPRLLLPVLALAVASALPRNASAQLELAGTATAHLLLTTPGEVGGALGVDLTAPVGPLRLGGYFGVGALPSDVDTRNRTFMPLAATIGLELGDGPIGVSLRARGGLWGGATQEVKLTFGGYVGGGAYLGVDVGGGARIAIGLDVWGLLGDGGTAVFAPGLGLTWGPSPMDDPTETPE
jgi:hypothetical protein